MSIFAAHKKRDLQADPLESTTFVVQRRQRCSMLNYAFSDGHWYPSFSTGLLNRNPSATRQANRIFIKIFNDSALRGVICDTLT